MIVLRARRRLAAVLYALLVATLAVALALTAPSAHWSNPVLLCTLAALAVTATFSSVNLPWGGRWDADSAVALIALVVAGPLPAFVVWLAPEAARTVTRRDGQRVRFGQIVNIAGTGWPLLAAWGVLKLGGVHGMSTAALPIILMAGLVLNLANQALVPMIYQPLWQGVAVRRVLADLRHSTVSDIAMIALGTLTAVLLVRFGYATLVLFAAIILIPRATIEFLAHARSVTRLSVPDAAAKYSQALGSALGMSREDRKTLIAILAIAAQHDARRSQPDAQQWTPTKILLQRFTEVMSAAWMMSEWWDGSGPAHVGHDGIPLAARVASVAQAWSALTAAGGPQLSHEDALTQLRAESGTRLDPAVVDTMAEVIELERCLSPRPACEPRVYRLPLPAHWREAFALRLGRLDASGA